MSRLGKKEILIPAGVTVEVKGSTINVKGPKGELTYDFRSEISIVVNDNVIVTSVKHATKNASAYWGLVWALVSNMVLGVSEGFEKKLELVGVGYRVKQSGKNVTITVGYSHPIEFSAPEGTVLEVVDEKNMTVKGVDKQLVGQTAAKIRSFRKPEPYKGKGIKYAGEVVRRKAGKTGKV